MILFFGPTGAGKSVQARQLADTHGWRWISTGQLLRDSQDPAVIAQMKTGRLTDEETVNRVMSQALGALGKDDRAVMDGFPRTLEQAKWLHDFCVQNNQVIDLVVVLEVPQEELQRRLSSRGRLDDTPESIAARLTIYNEKNKPILRYFTEHQVKVVQISGIGTIDEVNQRIEAELSEIHRQ